MYVHLHKDTTEKLSFMMESNYLSFCPHKTILNGATKLWTSSSLGKFFSQVLMDFAKAKQSYHWKTSLLSWLPLAYLVTFNCKTSNKHYYLQILNTYSTLVQELTNSSSVVLKYKLTTVDLRSNAKGKLQSQINMT